MVPQHFHTVFRDRERHLTQPFNTHAVVYQLGIQGVTHGAAAHVVRVAEITVPRINVHLVGGRITLEQRFLAFGQFVFVLSHILRSDHQDRLFSSIGINRLITGKLNVVPARYFAQVFTGVRRNGARRIAGLLSTHTGQLLAQLGRFCG